jgi:hypothetical protein
MHLLAREYCAEVHTFRDHPDRKEDPVAREN